MVHILASAGRDQASHYVMADHSTVKHLGALIVDLVENGVTVVVSPADSLPGTASAINLREAKEAFGFLKFVSKK